MKHLYLTAGLALLMPATASAQLHKTPQSETEADTAEVIAVGQIIDFSQKDELTSPTSVLTELEIETRGQAYLSDLLRSLPGISINQSGSTGSLTQLRMRGTEANHVLVLIDGVEVSNPNTGEFDFAGLRAENIVRVEVLRGEQSAIYGSDAVGGVINIITKSGYDRAGLSASVEGGSRAFLEGNINAVVPIGEASLSINGNAFETHGYDISGLGGEKDGSKSHAIDIGVNNVNLGPLNMSAKFSGSELESEFDSDTDFNGRLDNTNEELFTENRAARIDAQFSHMGFDSLITATFTKTDTSNPLSSFRNDTTGKRKKLNWAVKKSWSHHNVTVLAETERENFSNFGGTGGFQNQDESIRNDAVAGDYRFHNGTVTLTGSIRQDFNDRFDNAVTWRAGAGYKFNWNGRIRGSYGTGVKNPTMTELFGFFPGSFIGNPNIMPETSKGYNIGYEQAFLEDSLTLSIDYFRSDLKDEITTIFTPTFTSTVQNLTTDSKREGVELEARWQLGNTVNLRGSATILDTKQNGAEEIRRPEFIASATATVRPIEALSLTASIDHNGSQLDTDFATFTTVKLDAFTLVGLNASYDMNDIITLTLRGDNLLDKKYEEVVGYASQGRGIYAGLRANFK